MADGTDQAVPFAMKRTRYELRLDWSSISNMPRPLILMGFSRVLDACRTGGVQEVVVENIAPSFSVGRDDPNVVIASQDDIVSIFRKAVAAQHAAMPEFRLGLRRGQFDVRFYVGQTRPTDYGMADTDR